MSSEQQYKPEHTFPGRDKSKPFILVKLYQNLVLLIQRKRAERITVMFIPHNEKKIRNYHISNLTLDLILGFISLVVITSSILIINHNSTLQEVDKLKISQQDAKIQFSKIRQEIQEVDQNFHLLQENLYRLHNLYQGKNNRESLSGIGGGAVPMSQAINETVESENSEKVPSEIFMLNRIAMEMQMAETPLGEIEGFLKKRAKVIKSTPTLWPVQGSIINPFGHIRNAEQLTVQFNPGIDIATVPGSAIVSTAPGVVLSVKSDARWQYIVRIRHNFGYETVYKGLGRVTISPDSKVNKGELIGYSGHPFDSMESILHYQILIGVDPQDPLPYLSYIAD